MKSRLLTVFLFLATLVWGGASVAFAAPDEPCQSHRLETVGVFAPLHHGSQDTVSSSLPAGHHGALMPDCCAGIGGCRMLSCAHTMAILPVSPGLFVSGTVHALPMQTARLDGRNEPPVLGPPRYPFFAT